MAKSSIQNYLSLSIKLILVLSIINAIQNQLWHLMSANIFLLVLMFAPQIIKRYKVEIPSKFEGILLVFVIFTLFLGNFRGIIAPIAFGITIGFIGFLILAILYSSNQIKKNYFLILLFSFNFAVAFGFGLELLKFYLKIALNQELSYGIYEFTMMNMTYVVIGALISSIIGFIYMKGKPRFLSGFIDKIKDSNPKVFKKENSGREVLELINKGESDNLEFKETLRYNIYTNEIDRKIEHSVLKTISGFLNSSGGNLIIGVKDSGEIVGIEKDGFENPDKFLLHLNNIIKQRIGKKYLNLIKSEIFNISDKRVVLIECKQSKEPVFLKSLQNQEEFYVRTGNSTTQIFGSEMVDYIGKRFK